MKIVNSPNPVIGGAMPTFVGPRLWPQVGDADWIRTLTAHFTAQYADGYHMSNRIVVVGAGGFIGSQLVQALLADGAAVTTVQRSGPTNPAPEVSTPPVDYTSLLAAADAVVWLACTSTPGSSAGHPLLELDENLRPLLTLLGVLQDYPLCKLLYVSTGGALYGDLATGAAHEEQMLLPKSYYGAGKAAAEHFISACSHQYGFRATILRPSNVYGYGQPYRPGFGIVPTVFRAIRNKADISIWGDGQTTRDYLNIADFVALCRRVLAQPMSQQLRTFNASSGCGITINELLAAIERITGESINRVYHERRTIDVSRIVLDNRRACETFGWQPLVPLESGLAQAWTWFRSQQP